MNATVISKQLYANAALLENVGGQRKQAKTVSKGAFFTSLLGGTTTNTDMLGVLPILGREENTLPDLIL